MPVCFCMIFFILGIPMLQLPGGATKLQNSIGMPLCTIEAFHTARLPIAPIHPQFTTPHPTSSSNGLRHGLNVVARAWRACPTVPSWSPSPLTSSRSLGRQPHQGDRMGRQWLSNYFLAGLQPKRRTIQTKKNPTRNFYALWPGILPTRLRWKKLVRHFSFSALGSFHRFRSSCEPSPS